MFCEHDRILHIPTNKPAFIVCIDEGIDEQTGVSYTMYGIEVEDQNDTDWFYWAEESELKKIPEHKLT